MRKRHLALATLVVAAAVSLAACGSSDDSTNAMSDGMPSSTPSGSTQMMGQFNGADVAFATDMISHHRQAVEMAALAASRADSPEVKALATQIHGAQDPEIQMMSGWLTTWKRPVPEDMSGMDMSGTMPGMMSTADMAKLKSSSGAEFDQMFLTMMIAHHQGAIEMAQIEQEDGTSAKAMALARKIQSAQSAEITTMQGLLN